jgi:molybdate transport system regulatory protein
MKIKSNLWFENEQNGYFGKGRIDLLEHIDRFGSISQAAREMKMSYKAAWDAVNDMNTLSNEPIVVRETGGKGGGGTSLTSKGKEYIKIYKELELLQSKLFNILNEKSDTFENLMNVGKRLTLQTSARNQYTGIVTSIKSSSVEFDVELDIGAGEKIYARVTHKSAKAMGIDIGSTIFALIKSNWVTLFTQRPESDDQHSNCLEGEITEIEDDGSFVEVSLSLKGGNTITSVITSQLSKELSLKIGDKAYASFQPSDVLLAR